MLSDEFIDVLGCSETEAAGAGGKAATASQGESTGAAGSRMVAQGIPSVGSVPGDTQPDPLQAHADGVVADCISSILDDVTLEEFVARSPKRPVQDWNLEDAQVSSSDSCLNSGILQAFMGPVSGRAGCACCLTRMQESRRLYINLSSPFTVAQGEI